MDGSKDYDNKWTKKEKAEINLLLKKYDRQKPSEVHRAIRTLDLINYWKGTEFRTFLLYIGMVLLKNFLIKEEYDHFMLLCCAVIICSNDVYKAYLPKAQEMFEEYVEDHINIYGIHSIISNIHNLCHIVDDVKQLGNLNEISTYQFENCLGDIKLKLKSHKMPLEQISRRLIELSSINMNSMSNFLTSTDQFKIIVKNRVFQRNNSFVAFTDITIRPNVLLSSRKFGDKWFLTKNNVLVKMKYAIIVNGEYKIRGNSIQNKTDFFTYPFSSHYINIYQSEIIEGCCEDFVVDSIKAKMFCLEYNNSGVYVFIPLLHSF